MSRAGTARERHLAQSLPGRGTGTGRPGISNVLFRPITLISLVLIGLFAFSALIVLGGFAKDLRKAPPGQATPRSVSAVGYQAYTEYLAALNYDVQETRGKRPFYDRDERLVVYTPSRPTRRLKKIIEAEGEAVNFIILPKWSVGQMIPQDGEEAEKGWARKIRGTGLYYPNSYQSMMDDLPIVRRHDVPSPDTQVFFTEPRSRQLLEGYKPDFKDLQYFDLNTRWNDYNTELREIAEKEREERLRKIAEERGETYEPKEKKDPKKSETKKSKKKEEEKDKTPEPLPNPDVLFKIDGRAVLIRLEDTQTYILSEPDLLNTMAFTSQGGAQLSHVLLDEVIRSAGISPLSVDFDVSLHGIEANRNIVKLMVTPPFLAATLCLLAAGGLVMWQGFNRFGDPIRLRPDYAQGPVSLAETAADFMAVANRAHKTGGEYAALIRRHVANELGIKARSEAHMNALLDAREKRLNIQPGFEDLERAISNADTQAYTQYARALADWRKAMTQNDSPQDPKNS